MKKKRSFFNPQPPYASPSRVLTNITFPIIYLNSFFSIFVHIFINFNTMYYRHLQTLPTAHIRHPLTIYCFKRTTNSLQGKLFQVNKSFFFLLNLRENKKMCHD